MEKKNKKLIIAISSSALFDLSRETEIYNTQGLKKYKEYQEKNLNNILEPGVAFKFIEKLLKLNNISGEKIVEVILFSRNNQETGLRIFNSINYYHLDIEQAAFFSGHSPADYIKAFNVSLFLSTNKEDVDKSLKKGKAAGLLIGGKLLNKKRDDELRIVFDYDGIIIDDSSQQIFDQEGVEKFNNNELEHSDHPHAPGPLKNFIAQLTYIKKLEKEYQKKHLEYKRQIKIMIVTARSMLAYPRLAKTLKVWGIEVDEVFLLNGQAKTKILKDIKPHIYFDDQYNNLKEIKDLPLVHIPFGKLNQFTD